MIYAHPQLIKILCCLKTKTQFKKQINHQKVYRHHSWWGVLDTSLCHKVCQWLATGRWFSPGPPISSTNKTDGYNITEKMFKVALNTMILTRKIIVSVVLARRNIITWEKKTDDIEWQQSSRKTSKIKGNIQYSLRICGNNILSWLSTLEFSWSIFYLQIIVQNW